MCPEPAHARRGDNRAGRRAEQRSRQIDPGRQATVSFHSAQMQHIVHLSRWLASEAVHPLVGYHRRSTVQVLSQDYRRSTLGLFLSMDNV